MLPNVLQRSASDPHVPVLADEVRELLAVQPGDTVVDATFGAGGHARLLAEDLRGRGQARRDRPRSDGQAVPRPSSGAQAGVDVRFLRGDFAVVLAQLAANGVGADAILLDLGVSSMQIDRVERGFSYATDAPLDMRMDPASEPLGARGRQHVGRARARAHLPQLRRGAVRASDRAGDRAAPGRASVRADGRARGHDQGRDPDTGSIRRGASGQARLPGAAHRRQRRAGRARGGASGRRRDAPPRRPHRRHQLPLARGPDRQALLRGQAKGCTCPPEFPVCVCGKEPELRLLTRKPVRPSAAEIADNPRAASARLRAAAKVA